MNWDNEIYSYNLQMNFNTAYNNQTQNTVLTALPKNINTDDKIVEVPTQLKPKEYAYMRKILDDKMSEASRYTNIDKSKLTSQHSVRFHV